MKRRHLLSSLAALGCLPRVGFSRVLHRFIQRRDRLGTEQPARAGGGVGRLPDRAVRDAGEVVGGKRRLLGSDTQTGKNIIVRILHGLSPQIRHKLDTSSA